MEISGKREEGKSRGVKGERECITKYKRSIDVSPLYPYIINKVKANNYDNLAE